MSLASLLFTTKKKQSIVDDGLDEIFKTSAGPSTSKQLPVSHRHESSALKRKNESGETKTGEKAKKPRVSFVGDASSRSGAKVGLVGKSSRKGKETRGQVEDNEEQVASEGEAEKGDRGSSGSSDSESDDDVTVPVHETLLKAKRAKRDGGKKRVKYIPEGETKEQRDARSIFIGNLPVQIVKSRPLTKQLKRHIISLVPTAKIESVRFRSVAYKNPTTKLDLEDDGPSAKQQRQKQRAADWRDQTSSSDHKSKKDKEDEEEDKKGEKSYLTPAQKRRLAAIKGDLHEHTAATANAYIVFAHPFPDNSTESEARRHWSEAMDPFEAARQAVKTCEGTSFEDRILRVDFVGRTAAASRVPDAAGSLTDPKLSVFVGNLDFASGEDDVRAFFEKVVCEERGTPGMKVGEAEDGVEDNNDDKGGGESEEEQLRKGKAAGGNERRSNPSESADRRPTWVTRVRVVRDRDTQLGKGFAYVQFVDRECVDEVLSLEAEKLKFAKRTLRVQRCKTLRSASVSSTKNPADAKQPNTKTNLTPGKSADFTSPSRTRPSLKATAPPRDTVVIPKGDPMLGKRLSGLSKESRKEVKATDPERVARRVAKKKARIALEKAGIKERKMKERPRERRDKKGTLNTGRKDGKRRVRSERNVERRNTKK